MRHFQEMRTDAQRNRQRLLDAAGEIFRERGLDVGVGEIADAAGVGRATLFRNFATKDDLIAAIVLERFQGAIEAGRELLDSDADDTEVVFTFIADIVGRQQADRALLEGVSETIVTRPDVAAVHAEILSLLGQLLERGKRAGAIRPEVVPSDVLMLVKGICMTVGAVPGSSHEALIRHLELVRAAISTPAYSRPLRGSPTQLEETAPALEAR